MTYDFCDPWTFVSDYTIARLKSGYRYWNIFEDFSYCTEKTGQSIFSMNMWTKKKKNEINKTTLGCLFIYLFFFITRSPPPTSTTTPVSHWPLYKKKRKKWTFITPSDTGKQPFLFYFFLFSLDDNNSNAPFAFSPYPSQCARYPLSFGRHFARGKTIIYYNYMGVNSFVHIRTLAL